MKPIFLSEADIDELIDELKAKMGKTRMFDGSFEFKYVYEFKDKHPKANLIYTASAWAKMKQLVMDFSSEVGWHGIIHREDENTFIVTDILVYPQTVTGATVTTNEEEYHKFITPYREEMAEDPTTSINFHGHSHVNFAVSPSTVDISDQKQKMESMKRGFYVFTIHNKKGESNTWIYDFDNNMMYDNNEIEQTVLTDDGELFDFIAASKKVVKTSASPIAKADKKDDKYPKYWNAADKKEEKKGNYFDDDESPYLPGYYPYGDSRYNYGAW